MFLNFRNTIICMSLNFIRRPDLFRTLLLRRVISASVDNGCRLLRSGKLSDRSPHAACQCQKHCEARQPAKPPITRYRAHDSNFTRFQERSAPLQFNDSCNNRYSQLDKFRVPVRLFQAGPVQAWSSMV